MNADMTSSHLSVAIVTTDVAQCQDLIERTTMATGQQVFVIKNHSIHPLYSRAGERHIDWDPTVLPLPTHKKKPGPDLTIQPRLSGSERNQPCPCGSGRKRKHCCGTAI